MNLESVTPFEYIEYMVGNTPYKITPHTDPGYRTINYFHIRENLQDNSRKDIRSGKSNNEDKIKEDSEDLRHYGFVYSKARSGFKTKQVKSITTQQIDSQKREVDEEDDFTRIKQMLVDIAQQDDADWRIESEKGGLSDQKYNEFITQRSKGYRFTEPFNNFFEDIQYKKVDNNNPTEKPILFEKHGKNINVDQLSTGEKQIVFRGAHLLRNLNSINGGIVLIDEPELSVHPKWQEKILAYYRGLFTVNSVQSVQLIIATHSEYIIRSALEDSDNILIIVLSDDNGTITSKKITAPMGLEIISLRVHIAEGLSV